MSAAGSNPAPSATTSFDVLDHPGVWVPGCVGEGAFPADELVEITTPPTRARRVILNDPQDFPGVRPAVRSE